MVIFIVVFAKRTSYNTYENKHLLGGIPFRGNYAGIGYTYFTPSNIFMPPKPYASWSLDVSNAVWVAPISKPDDGKIIFGMKIVQIGLNQYLYLSMNTQTSNKITKALKQLIKNINYARRNKTII